MKRSRRSPEYEEFKRRLRSAGWEMYSRLGDPILVHKYGEPYSRDSVGFVFLANRRGKWPKKKLLGMEIYRALGLKVFKYVPANPK